MHGLRNDAEAFRLLQAAVRDLSEYQGEDKADVGVFATVLGGICGRRKDFKCTAENYGLASQLLTPVWGAEDPRIGGLARGRALALRRSGEFAEAARVDAEAMRLEVRAALKR